MDIVEYSNIFSNVAILFFYLSRSFVKSSTYYLTKPLQIIY